MDKKELRTKFVVVRNRCVSPDELSKMAQQAAQSTLDYLNEEVLNLIQNNQINESNFILFRLQKLLEKFRVRFGDDPENAIFRKILRLSLKSMNFFLANYILDNFIKSNLRPISAQTADLLFLTMYYVKDQAKEFHENLQTSAANLNNLIRNRPTFNYVHGGPPNQANRAAFYNLEHFNPATNHTSKFCDFSSFDKLVDKLIPHSNVNQFYLTYGTSLLAMVIENISSTELNPTCKLTLKERLFQICYDKLMRLDYLDVNVGYEKYMENLNDDDRQPNEVQVNRVKRTINLPGIKRISILQQAVNDLKYDVAEQLVLKGARCDNLNIDDVVFVKSTERLFKALYFAGYKFLPVNIFRLKYDQCIKDDECFESFCEQFLKVHQTKQLPLSCLCWVVLRRCLGSKSNILLRFLSERMQLPDGFMKFAKFQSLEILFEKS